MNNVSDSIQKMTIGIGCVRAAGGHAQMSAYALGSCIALCLYDPISGIGAMAHILLPSGSYTGHPHRAADTSTKYADRALASALQKMHGLGAEKSSIRAAIIGGAMMFPHGSIASLNIGEMNISSVSLELQKNGIPLEYSATGGCRSRTVHFSVPGSSFERQLTVITSHI